MAKKTKYRTPKRYRDAFRYVFLTILAKDLDPDVVTKSLGIEPDSSWRRGFIKDKEGNIIKDRNGKRRKSSVGGWILEAHVHENSSFEARMSNILEQIRPKKKVLKQILKKSIATLTIVIEPHNQVCTRCILLPAGTLNEFTSLGIDIEFSVDNPQQWTIIRQEIEAKEKRKSKRQSRK